ncbi:MAG: carboxypeptidase-like regulatory domain-containing protein, partial [Bacteroidota bacterium]
MKINFLLLVSLFSVGLMAQTGSVKGLITDSEDGSGLPGASVFIKDNAALGTVTDIDGSFLLQNIPVGEQVITISFIGFTTEERMVTITEGNTAEIAVKLGGAVILGEEVLVTAQALGQAKAINQQLASDGIANFVSADKIKELPDVNAAEAISRLPGVAINRSGGEGSKIVVRGLDPKFTAININGVRLPSTSGNDRSVDLALISPELLSGIELFKSPTPDMDGDALGGTVNLNIIKADDRPRASLKALGGYNGVVDEFKDYKLTGSLNRRVFNNKLGVIATANVERFNRSARIVGGNWTDNGEVLDTFLNIQEQIANGLRFTHRREIRRRYNASLGLDYDFGQNTEVTVLGIYSRTTRDQFTHTETYGIDGFGGGPSLNESSIDLYSGSLTARHNLSFMNIEWGASYSKTMGQTPLNLGFGFVGGGGQDIDPAARQEENRQTTAQVYAFANPDINNFYLTRSNYQDTGNEEAISTAFIDFKIPFNLGDSWRGEFKFGGKYRVNEKSRFYNRFSDKLYYLRPLSHWDGLLPEGQELLAASNLTDR